MRLIAASSAFVSVLAALHAACFARPWDEPAFAGILAAPGTFGWIAADEAAEPLGFVLCRAVADEAEVLSIGVRPDRRGGGIARCLLEQAAATARDAGAARMFLEVAVNNRAALALYRAHHFERVGTREKYYLEFVDGRETRSDAYVMTKILE